MEIFTKPQPYPDIVAMHCGNNYETRSQSLSHVHEMNHGNGTAI